MSKVMKGLKQVDLDALIGIEDFEDKMLSYVKMRNLNHFVINRMIQMAFYALWVAWKYKCYRIKQGGNTTEAEDPRDEKE